MMILLESHSQVVLEAGMALANILKSVFFEIPEILFASDDLSLKTRKYIFYIGSREKFSCFQLTTNLCRIVFFPVLGKSEVQKISFKECNKPLVLKFGKISVYKARKTDQPFIFNDHLKVAVQNKLIVYLLLDLLTPYYQEIVKHGTGQINANRVCALLRLFRVLFRSIDMLSAKRQGAVTLFTIDAEDQHSYYDNKNGFCTDLNHSVQNKDDMVFSNLLDVSIQRLLPHGIKPIFLVTGSELRQEAVDGFGNPLRGTEDNIAILRKASKNPDISIGFHSYDHERWLLYGSANLQPMTTWAKITYFSKSGGNSKTLISYLKLLTRIRRKEKVKLGKEGNFTNKELDYQIKNLENLFQRHGIVYLKFHRHPGFRRSDKVVSYLSKNDYIDSSDLIDVEKNPSPPIPYFLFNSLNGQISLSNLCEFPCLFIDKFLRTKSRHQLNTLLRYLKSIYEYDEAVLTIVTHTKVVGGDLNHTHYYPRNPLSGLAQPMKTENFNKICKMISSKSRSVTLKNYLEKR